VKCDGDGKVIANSALDGVSQWGVFRDLRTTLTNVYVMQCTLHFEFLNAIIPLKGEILE
jgi:hypothetical protein